MDRQNWNSLAEAYERDLLEIACTPGGDALREELQLLGGGGKRVADLGCGPGSLLTFLAERFEEVFAVDYAESLLEVAGRRCGSANVRFHCCDLSAGSGLSIRAEVVACVNALIDPRRRKREGMLQALRGVLTPGGVAVVVVPAFESVFHVYHTLQRIRCQQGKPAGLASSAAERQLRSEVDSFARGIVRVGGVRTKYWMREELIAVLAGVGLRVDRVRRIEYGWEEELENPPAGLAGARPWDWLMVAGCE